MRLPMTGLFVVLLLKTAAGSEDKCATSNSYMCPHLTDLCNETVYVSDCMNDCEGYLGTYHDPPQCFDRKLLNGRDNPDPSYLWRDVLGIMVWFVTAGIAIACGVGGGGIYDPLGILLLHFAPKASSGLSQASIFGATLGGLLLNTRDKHPFTTKVVVGTCTGDHETTQTKMISVPSATKVQPQNSDNVQFFTRPLIDFDMALFLAPMQMAGAVLGVLIQTVLPNWLYMTLSAVILTSSFTAYVTFRSFLRKRKTEKEEAGANRVEVAIQEGNYEKEPCFSSAAEGTEDSQSEAYLQSTPSTNVQIQDHEQDSSMEAQHKIGLLEPNVGPVHTHEKITQEEKEPSDIRHTKIEAMQVDVRRCLSWLEKDQRQFPTDKIMGLLILWIGLILLTFCIGGKGLDSVVGITCTSPWYAVLIAIQFAWTLGIASFSGYKLMKATKDKKACGYPFHPQDVMWDFQQIRFYSFCTFMAGTIAGLVGIGGGMILGPLMLVMGVHPQVSSATNATMIVLTSSSVAVSSVTAGLVPWEYSLTFFCVCCAGAYLGKNTIGSYVKQTRRANLLICLLATIITLTTVGCIVFVLTGLAQSGWYFAGVLRHLCRRGRRRRRRNCMPF